MAKKPKDADQSTEVTNLEAEEANNPTTETGGKSKNSATSQAPNKKYKYVIQNKKARYHQKKRTLVVILLIVLLLGIALGATVYGIYSFIEYNNFRVLIEKEGANILSLSNSAHFSDMSEVLSLGGPKYMDNITLMDIYYKIPEISEIEGNYGDGTQKYIASTFYLKNISDQDQIYRETIVLGNITNAVDEALRIMIIRDGIITVYGKARPDGSPEEVVPGQGFSTNGVPDVDMKDPEYASKVWYTVPFLSDKHVFYNTGIPLKKDQVVKYTVLVWLEGWDAECVDARLGGTISMELQFTQGSD